MNFPKLPGTVFPQNVMYTNSIENVCKSKEIILFSVPSVFVRNTAQKVKPYISDDQIIVDVAKGIESDTLMTLTEIIEDELSEHRIHLVVLSGPTHAEEVAMQLPTTIVSASKNQDIAKRV
ncbi:hypothetical protein ABWR62_01320 [Enterococcus faecium]|nr:hypothetical protein [Enterococcus faecium]MDQ8233881.1 hypothetical protein [Enterococcus faecium]MDQ8270232.1 hypothetical protein [Enterococcus faecium]